MARVEEQYRHLLRKHPKAFYWLKRGIHPKAARELAAAGILTLDDLAGRTREDLSAIPGMGLRSLAKLEEMLGSVIPSRKGDWEERGLPRIVANALGRAGIDSMEKLGRLTREQFLSFSGLGEGSLKACERILGRPLDSPVRSLRQQGLRAFAAHRLSRAGFRTVQELAKMSDLALRRMGLPSRDIEVCRSLGRVPRKTSRS
ncbi:MAG TPA: helix-hairpin-helix domain-containing protein [Thermoanaerobaculia bacterium]|nr:helix-hairpin-helix domain-containing protein [Thermoanaerobaculia bacterium]